MNPITNRPKITTPKLHLVTKTQAQKDEILVHRNRQPKDAFILPAERFGENNINLVEVLLEVAEKEFPKYNPFVSITGSTTYALQEDCIHPDWDAVHDLDLRVHVNNEVPHDEIVSFMKKILDRLKEKGGLIINIPKEHNDRHIDLWGIREVSGKFYVIEIGVNPIDELFAERSSPSTYKLSDAFFGRADSLSQLNKKLTEMGIKNIIKNAELFYRSVLEEIENGVKDPNTPVSRKAKYLKKMYHMLTLRGKQSEYGKLLEQYKQHQERFDEENFKEICKKLLPIIRDTNNLEKESINYYK